MAGVRWNRSVVTKLPSALGNYVRTEVAAGSRRQAQLATFASAHISEF